MAGKLPNLAERLLIAIFVLAIAAPLVATVAGDRTEDTSEENREAAPPPAWPDNLATLAAWPEAFTKYYADQFAFRSALVRWQALFRVRVLGSSPTSDVILGHDQWLYYATDGAIEDFTGTRPFTAPELDVWRDTLQHTQDWLGARGMAYVFAIAPDKHLIYPEFMPEGVHRSVSGSRVDQLLAHLRAHSTVNAVDLRPVVRAARDHGRLFHKTDTHWNDLGALAGYQEVIRRAGEPGRKAAALHEFERHVVVRPGLDLARMLGLKAVIEEEDLQLEPRTPRRARVIEPHNASRALMDARVVTEQPGDAPRAVVFRDSFGSAMIPFLSEHFSRAVYAWQNEVDPALILQEQPAVVIQEWVGRHLYTAAPYDAVTVWEYERAQRKPWK